MKLTEQNESKEQGFWIKRGVWVFIPKGRANEIPKVIEEHHKQEAQRQLLY